MSSPCVPTEEIMQNIRAHRSSESNYAALQEELDRAIAASKQASSESLAGELQEVKEKYAAEYEKAKETGGSAWPEFEKFVTQFERALTNAAR